MSLNLFIIYITTNNFNSEYYLGYHGTNDINDDYLGSGIKLKASIKKYRKENFTREVLFVYETPEEAFIKEVEIVNPDTIKDPCCLNLVCGGGVGGSECSLSSREKMSEAAQNRTPETRKKMSEWERTPEYRKKMSIAQKNRPTVTQEARKKMSEAKRKINDDQIQEIIELRETGMLLKDIGKIYGVTQRTISNYLKKYKEAQN